MSDFDWQGRCLCDVGERPAGYGAYVCGRKACRIALKASVMSDPGLSLCIKWGLGARTVIRADLFLVLLANEDGPDITPVAKFLNRDVEPHTDTYEDQDGTVHTEEMYQYVREIFVVHDEARDGAF